mgnify:CR=1 FL=1
MLLLIICFVVFIISFVFCYFIRNYYNCDFWEVAGNIICIFAAIVLIIGLILIPISRINIKSKIVELESTRFSIFAARLNKSIENIENAAIQHKIIEMNSWLAKGKYCNDTIFDLWIPNEIDYIYELQ